MLIAIGIYKLQSSVARKKSYVKLEAVPPISTGLQAFNALANFEIYTLATLTDFERYATNIMSVSGRREFHYLKKIDADTILVIVSKTFIECTRERPELYKLQNNIELAYRYPERTRTTLQNILDNPLAYTGSNILIDGVQKLAEETIEEALKALDAVIERGDSIEILLHDTKELARETRTFQIQAKNLNRGCCW